jgi:hypothetical protein
VVFRRDGQATRRGGRRPICTLLEQRVPGKPCHPLAHADVRDPAAGGTGSVPRGASCGLSPVAELMPSPTGGLLCNPAELVEIWIGGRAHVAEAIGPPVGTVARRPRGNSLDLIRRRASPWRTVRTSGLSSRAALTVASSEPPPTIRTSWRSCGSVATTPQILDASVRAGTITLTRGRGGSALSAFMRVGGPKVPWLRAPSSRSLGPDGYAAICDSVSPMFARSMFVTSKPGHYNFDAISTFQRGTSNADAGRPKWRRRATAGVDPNPSDEEGT